ncbi:MAG TPA: universal stress protein [Anaerolineae bacterium]|nr:universal stress protein [Anaerolineae bacterium]HNU03040.1 universal stress protein [Anaerolineae bacterium]
MAHPARSKLRNSLQGVLAGGSVPVSAPLLSLGSFWRLLAVAGATGAAAGASLWLAALTLLAAALVYGVVILAPLRRGRLPWVHNGRGAAGLSEEEFGAWAIKVNAAVTFLLYILAFLVSLSAALTLLADRFPALDHDLFLGIAGRDLLAAGLAVALAWLVSHRPRRLVTFYGLSTGAALALLWGLVIAAVWHSGGLRLPPFSTAAFASWQSVQQTAAGLARLLAILVGIEVFTTLEPAFQGDGEERARKAFGSLALTAVTGLAALLILGPLPLLGEAEGGSVSPTSQVLQALLPGPLIWLALLIATALLLSAAAASAQALQNLSLGLATRRFAPSFLAQRNRAGAPERPVELLAAIAAACFLLLGARAEIYLPVFVAGSLLLLTIVAWAAWRRARREARVLPGRKGRLLSLTLFLAALTISLASLLAAVEGFARGAWVLLLAAPLLYALFHFTRRRLGSPNPLQEELGRREGAMHALASPRSTGGAIAARLPSTRLAPAAEAIDRGAAERWQQQPAAPRQVAIALDGSEFAERALPSAVAISRQLDATLVLISVLPGRGALRVLPRGRSSGNPLEAGQPELETYLDALAGQCQAQGVRVETYIAAGPVAQSIAMLTRELRIDLLVMSTHGRSGVSRFMLGSNASALLQLTRVPVILLRPQALAAGQRPILRRVLVTLDGSSFGEQVLPWARLSAQVSGAELLLLTVPEIPEPAMYGALGDAVDELRQQADANARRYLERTAALLTEEGLAVSALVEGSRPATTILDVAEREEVDLIMVATHGRGGVERLFLGSVADRVVHHSRHPVMLIPTRTDDA